MCSRYELIARPRDLVERFDLPDPPPLPAEGDLRPTDRALVIAGARRTLVLSWGFPAPWDGKPLINARAETLTRKQIFQPLLENRCLIPATAYFEWRRDGRARRKNRIAPASTSPDGARPFAFAGLMDGTHFTIITCAPTPGIAHIHNRMPVTLDPAQENRWLDPAQPFQTVRDCLIPYAAGPLDAVEAPPRISQPDLFGGS